ncbi:hypothetical protein M011DRAFT_459771 [Sporormia fimetaria CBS 119925]|uniref:Uncharacterized protein n=1 Tax=Sporormia fimetaria CBS 119925 TaxID=1340428 RepID=A0A6A6V9B2_9PLEO|nr:hypothetical protein M011DRAFT_459771 [Sporormia fimetaria CBS 119925]
MYRDLAGNGCVTKEDVSESSSVKATGGIVIVKWLWKTWYEAVTARCVSQGHQLASGNEKPLRSPGRGLRYMIQEDEMVEWSWGRAAVEEELSNDAAEGKSWSYEAVKTGACESSVGGSVVWRDKARCWLKEAPGGDRLANAGDRWLAESLTQAKGRRACLLALRRGGRRSVKVHHCWCCGGGDSGSDGLRSGGRGQLLTGSGASGGGGGGAANSEQSFTPRPSARTRHFAQRSP